MKFTRESVFVSALRAFFNTIAIIIGLGVAIFLIALAMNKVDTNLDLPDKAELLVSTDANGNRKLLGGTTPVLLRINIEGVVGAHNLDTACFDNLLLTSREGILKEDRVKGILLYMNTPGGVATDGFNMYHALKRYKEKYKVPIYTYVDGLCASAGVMISCATDKIFSSPEGIIGSVGARMGPAFNVYDAMQKVGIAAKMFSAGKDKVDLSPFLKWEPDAGADRQAIVQAGYESFLDLVVAARPKLSRQALVNEYGAQVFTAQKAEELGYIDQAGVDYYEALGELAKAAEIEGEYQVFTAKPSTTLLKELSRKQSLLRGKVEHVFPTGPYTTTDMSGKLLFLHQP